MYVLGDMDQDGFYYVSIICNFYTASAASLLLHKSLTVLYILGGSTRTTRFGTIQLSAASTLGLEEGPRTFAKSQSQDLMCQTADYYIFVL